MKAKKSTPIDPVSLDDINMNQQMYETYTKNLHANNAGVNQMESSIADVNRNPFDSDIAKPLTALKNIPGPPISP